LGVGSWDTLRETPLAKLVLTTCGKEPHLCGKHGEGPMEKEKGSVKAKAKEKVEEKGLAKGKVNLTSAILEIARRPRAMAKRWMGFATTGLGATVIVSTGQTAIIDTMDHKGARKGTQTRHRSLPRAALRSPERNLSPCS
jgi:hypothetical protein